MSQHSKRVVMLYKKLLRRQRDWLVERDLINEMARKTRAVFDERASVVDPVLQKQYVKELEAEVELWSHPQPYILPTDPGGTSWQRNPPVPIELCDVSRFAKDYE
jgi:NADH dehydrogenase (ubiquinone) 1 beta subcomplex subunit 9